MKRTLVVAAAVIRRNGKVLLATRPADKPPAGLEFPGGKLEPGETLKQAAERELREELGVETLALDELYRITHETETAVIHLRFIWALLAAEAVITPREGQTFDWFDLASPMPEELLAPDRPVWEFLMTKEDKADDFRA